jgi:hypothetical protein
MRKGFGNQDILGYDTVHQRTKLHGITPLMLLVVNYRELTRLVAVSGAVFRPRRFNGLHRPQSLFSQSLPGSYLAYQSRNML